MAERRGDEAVAGDAFVAARAAPGHGRVPLHVVERRVDGGLVCRADVSRERVVAEPVEDADRLGRRERQVEAGDARAAPALGQRFTAPRVRAVEREAEPVALDLATDPELARSAAHPASGRLAGAGVVVLGALGDSLEVVALLPLAELSDRQHVGTESTECKCVRGLCGWRCGGY